MRNSFFFKILTSLFVCASVFFLVLGGGCAKPVVTGKPTIKITEGDWTSSQVIAEILEQIIGEQLGYPAEVTYAYGPIAWAGIEKGELDIAPEIWFEARRPEIQPFLDKGTIELAGEIFGGAGNFWVVPRYVVEGDPARGIEPMAPDLKTILDLKKYWQLFENPEQPGLGEIVGGEVGWIDETRWIILGYDLPLWKSNQSLPVMLARLTAAVKKGEPILMVIWSPQSIFSQVDLIKLESVDPDRTSEIDWDKDPVPVKTGLMAYTVHKVIRPELKNTAPDVYRLVHNMSFTEAEINELSYRLDVDEENMTVVASDWIAKNQDKINQWLGK